MALVLRQIEQQYLIQDSTSSWQCFQDEEESRLACEITAFEMLKAKEEELLELLHSEEIRGSDTAHLEIAATEVHEAEVQSATSRVTELLLQHAETKATAMINISVSQ